jgi:colicin import membrane protein
MAAADALPFPIRREPAMVRSFVLALLMHVLLIAIMMVGVRFQSRAPDVVSVELWEAPPPPPPPAPVVKPEPPPPPPPKAVEPEKPVAKPDIAVREKPKPKPKPKPKAEPPKRDLANEKRMKEQLAQEQKAMAEQQRALEEQRRERELRALIAKREAAAKQKALETWIGQIQNRIRSRIPVHVAEDVPGNPEAVFNVSLLPNAEVLNVRMRKSSGNRAYDEAVERAILAASPLPMPSDRSLFQRQLELTFRPKDKPGS